MTLPPRNKQEKPILQSIWDWFVNPEFGLGPAVDTNGKFQHSHSWQYFNTIRLGWRVENGLPIGERTPIGIAILDVEKYPNKNETTASQLRGWKSSGYMFVHLSKIVYSCKHHNCGATKNAEIYTAPVKTDGSGPIVVSTGERYQKKFAETTRIPMAANGNCNTTTRREIAIEPMKRHGSKPKPTRPAPVVAMEN
jgi:hypothetical protein